MLETAGEKRSMLRLIKWKKLRISGDCLEEEIIQDTIPGLRAQGRPKMGWIDNKVMNWIIIRLVLKNKKTEEDGVELSVVWPILG